MSLHAKYDFGKVTPGAIFRLPIDDIELDYVFNLYCTVKL
jgi:hypothetical protein